MTISCKVEEDKQLVTCHLTALPTRDDYQSTFPNSSKEIELGSFGRRLLVLEYNDPESDEDGRDFNAFVARDINKYVTRHAVVCFRSIYDRVRDVLEPISNQGKEVGMFETEVDARKWLCG